MKGGTRDIDKICAKCAELDMIDKDNVIDMSVEKKRLCLQESGEKSGRFMCDVRKSRELLNEKYFYETITFLLCGLSRCQKPP